MFCRFVDELGKLMGKKGFDLWKIEVGLQKLRRKPKFFRPSHRGLCYEKVFPSFVYLLRKKITSVGKIEEKGKMGPAQNKNVC